VEAYRARKLVKLFPFQQSGYDSFGQSVFPIFFLQERSLIRSSSFTSSAILGFANRLEQVSCQGVRSLNKMNYLKLLGFYGVQKKRF